MPIEINTSQQNPQGGQQGEPDLSLFLANSMDMMYSHRGGMFYQLK